MTPVAISPVVDGVSSGNEETRGFSRLPAGTHLTMENHHFSWGYIIVHGYISTNYPWPFSSSQTLRTLLPEGSDHQLGTKQLVALRGMIGESWEWASGPPPTINPSIRRADQAANITWG